MMEDESLFMVFVVEELFDVFEGGAGSEVAVAAWSGRRGEPRRPHLEDSERGV